MAVIPHSQMRLARMRRSLAQALSTQDWDQIKAFDLELMDALDAASEDEQRDSTSLLAELNAIVCLYKDIVLSSELHTRRNSGL
ncbi:hypothetical protein [Simiduia agarivorans]|uniref:Tryptophanyl-tRNA synthetase n=1 Tax=Simiduia agarivorans (strain DSM 21679 / JCM 13881 / BCRC 17597 / SA1) TaxID=1117647 RepID=K4KI99_SIMAS|nr:hypothetical protein [Simiduia agarivorans]AFU97678.1 tryptophanyl-tRNA synthetase [Simiduia agarivorans SA1 = DSM 21679]